MLSTGGKCHTPRVGLTSGIGVSVSPTANTLHSCVCGNGRVLSSPMILDLCHPIASGSDERGAKKTGV